MVFMKEPIGKPMTMGLSDTLYPLTASIFTFTGAGNHRKKLIGEDLISWRAEPVTEDSVFHNHQNGEIMATLKKYILVTNKGEQSLEIEDAKVLFEEKVSNLLNQGYECIGGVSITLSVTSTFFFAQAMEKPL
jgi:hypothetical protein